MEGEALSAVCQAAFRALELSQVFLDKYRMYYYQHLCCYVFTDVVLSIPKYRG